MDYIHLTRVERGRIQELFALGYSTRSIGLKVNRHHSSIARELKRNSDGNIYCGKTAQACHTR